MRVHTVTTKAMAMAPAKAARDDQFFLRVSLSKTVLYSFIFTSILLIVLEKVELRIFTRKDEVVLRTPESSTVSPTTTTTLFAANGGDQSQLRNGSIVPPVAWLMSFPNSGTSFTMAMVEQRSLRTTATNYAKEVNFENVALPIHPNLENGPFWRRLNSTESQYKRPSSYVLSKTHCGGRCNQCGPSRYVETPYSFLTQCLTGSRNDVYEDGVEIHKTVTYEPHVVKRAVHLIRNPFDNIVSRFHHSLKRNPNSGYRKTMKGFRSFCRDMNTKYAQQEEESRLVDSKILKILKDVPCHADFLRYVQWHNLAFTTTENLDITSHILHYEDYEHNYESTVDDLFAFLDLEQEGDEVEFISGKQYSSYFNNTEQDAVASALEKLASRKTWQNIQHYFGLL